MKMGSKAKVGNHMVDILFTLALFCVFAASALMVVLIGANVYKSTVNQMDRNFAGRTTLTYVATKIRQNDIAGGIHVEYFQGGQALVLDQRIEDEVYQTWIYHYDGAIREIFVAQGTPLEPENGQVILEIPGFQVQEAGDMLLLTAVDDEGTMTTQWVAPRCSIQ